MKEKKIFFTALFILLNTVLSAQYSGFKLVSNTEFFKNKFATESSKLLTISSQFKQEKILVALTEKITSEGKFLFKRSNKVRIEYQKPYSYLLVLNGDKMLVRDNQKENRINVKSNKLFQQVNRIMIDCVQGTMLDSKDFSMKAFEDEKLYLLEMTPTSKTLKEFFAAIIILVDKKDYSAKSIEMVEPGGDKTIITFTDKKLNTEIADAVFAL